MSGTAGAAGAPERTAAALEMSLARAEPEGTRPLAELVARLAAEGRLRSIVRDGSSVDPAELGRIDLAGVADDSRRVVAGGLFVAVPGDHVDGHDFAPAALAIGAVGAIVERPVAGLRGVQLVVERSAAALATAAAWWYGDPSHELSVVGVTGTDGKTTTSFLSAAVLEAAGIPTGLVGTVETRVGAVRVATPGHVTTPGALELQRLLRAMVGAGDRAAVIETTSHGLAAERVGGIAYDAAVFTNLSHEHLEFHGTFEAYRAAKLSLFERLGTARPAKPRDVRGSASSIATIPRRAASSRPPVPRAGGPSPTARGADADVRLTQLTRTARRPPAPRRGAGWDGRRSSYGSPAASTPTTRSPRRARSRLGSRSVRRPSRPRIGRSASPAAWSGSTTASRSRSWSTTPTARRPWRPSSTCSARVPRRGGGGVIAVFGSAGERDLEKRPMMGRIAGERCRLVVVTDEDPRGEDRQAILDEIAGGAEAAGRRRGRDLLLIADRSGAIAGRWRARPGDIVLLAGKGHERRSSVPTARSPGMSVRRPGPRSASLGYPGGD